MWKDKVCGRPNLSLATIYRHKKYGLDAVTGRHKAILRGNACVVWVSNLQIGAGVRVRVRIGVVRPSHGSTAGLRQIYVWVGAEYESNELAVCFIQIFRDFRKTDYYAVFSRCGVFLAQTLDRKWILFNFRHSGPHEPWKSLQLVLVIVFQVCVNPSSIAALCAVDNRSYTFPDSCRCLVYCVFHYSNQVPYRRSIRQNSKNRSESSHTLTCHFGCIRPGVVIALRKYRE